MKDACLTRTFAVAAAVAAAMLNGCGGDGGGGTITGAGASQGTTATPPPSVVVSSVTGVPLQAEYMGRMVFTTTRGGALEATVDWTYTANDVDALIVSGDCSYDQLDASQCSILGIAVSETAKPEQVTVASAPAGTYTIFIGNLGPGDESISYQVVLKPSTASSARTEPVPFQWKRRLQRGPEQQ